jgi:hypothetical protein
MKPSKGPWTIEGRKNENGLPDYYVILDANGRVIMDTFNSEVCTEETEYHNIGYDRWDEQGRVDCELVAELWQLFQLLTKGEV